MLCQNCHQRESTVFLTKVVNGQATQIHLCSDCAGKVQGFGFNLYPGMVSDFLQALFGLNPTGLSEHAAVDLQQEKCPGCGRTLGQIQQAGRMGCSKCYEIFEPQMEVLLRRIQGGAAHVGKVPHKFAAITNKKQKIEDLRIKLQDLIQKEEFEEAAKVRDQIRDLEKIAGGESE